MEAENADEALELLHLHHKAINVLFTDVHTPGDMDGLELAHHTRRQWPWVGILIASGKARRLRLSYLPAAAS